MKRNGRRTWLGLTVAAGVAGSALANERIFTYSYEPETLPAGALELEQWVTLRSGRTSAVGQEDYRRWQVREELEYGVNDNYTVSLYLNGSTERFKDPETGVADSETEFDGVSIENRYMVLNPAQHAVGLALYLEPSIGEDEAELEQKVILGQRHGDWKWVVNLTHATEWEDSFEETEGEVEVTAGLARFLAKRWTLGLELRDHNELPEYESWENTALYLGPTTSYRRERWWAALTVLPQVYGDNFKENPDNNSHLELEGHERINTRLLVGFGF